jgi:O-antigen/teichoic acid export membrane protein
LIQELNKEFIRKYASSALFRHILTTLSGTTIAQAIQVLAAPILTYYYSATLFGEFTLYFSIAGTLAVIATLRYELAIMLPEKDADALQLVSASLIISLALSLITYAAFMLTASYWSIAIGIDTIEKYLPWVCVSVFSSGIFQSLIVYISRNKKFTTVSVLRIIQALAFGVFPVVFYYLNFKTSGLVYGYVTSQAVSALVILFVSRSELARALQIFDYNIIRYLLKRYKGFPGYNSLHAFSDMLQNSIINFLINFYYGAAALGLYAMAYRVLRAPLGIIGSAISQVLYQNMSENYNNGTGNALIFNKMVRYTSYFSLPLFMLIAAIAPYSFSLILGEEWREAGWYVIYLTPLFLVTFVVSPMSHLPNITGNQGRFLLFISGINILSLIAFSILSVSLNSIYYSLLIYSLTWMLGYLMVLKWFNQLSHKSRIHA